ncbi:tol-pal system-associated acyl-CoA thioesterase [Caulobacter sp. KR2-114]|uniref:tol-pal system-associated acyl-CoA thioesterase n=1 Tax=Caulobacter sp. KR2-114 TaxID=3400912 RepID=UPI003C0FBEC7
MLETPTAGVLEGREHRLPVRIYYEDTDFTGLVYHANYLRYFERGRSDYLRVVGIDHTTLLERPDPCAFVVTRVELDFRKAARVDDALLVRTTYDEIRGVRLIIGQRIERAGELIAEAGVTAACITPDGRPRRPPAELVTRLRPLLAVSVAP